MILINRSIVLQDIVLTLGNPPAGQILELQHDETREKFEINLGLNNSPTKERYDLFTLNVSVFTLMPDGYYNYNVGDLDHGKLYILPAVTAFIPEAKDDSEKILVYTK